MRLPFLATLVLTSGVAAAAHAQPALSRIDRLFDLSTPEAAVEAYVEAFAADDFLAAYFILDPLAHEMVLRANLLFEFSQLTRLDGRTIMDPVGFPVALEHASDLEAPMVTHDIYQYFIFVMSKSDRADAHLIDFPGGGSLFGSEITIVSVGEPFEDDRRTRAWVDTDVPGEGPVRFLLQQSPAGRWRVLSITARPGETDEAVFLPVRD